MQHSTKKLGMMFTLAGWMLGLLLLFLVFSKILDHQSNPNRSIATSGTSTYQQVVLTRNRQGHYVFDGEINHKNVTFLVDTGATLTAIPEAMALELGLVKGSSFTVSTANGNSQAFMTRLSSLKIGEIDLTNVPASISPGLDINQILLGMNVLKHLELIQRKDQLIIRRYN